MADTPRYVFPPQGLCIAGADEVPYPFAIVPQKRRRNELPDVVRVECSDDALGARTPLTSAEREVAWRMAVGLRDREIAQASDASLRTVNTHVRSVLGKCDVASRAELAARVASHFARAAKESKKK